MSNSRTAAVTALLLTASLLAAQDLIHVTNSEELVRAIGSDRTVVLAEREGCHMECTGDKPLSVRTPPRRR